MECPKCGFQQLDDASECHRCGVVFGKLYDRPDDGHPPVLPPLPVAARVVNPAVARHPAEPPPYRMLAVAALVAIIFNYLPVVSWAMSALVTLFHEFGHGVVAWILGIPAIPAFDFAYGGGITHMVGFQPVLALIVFGLAAWGIRTLWVRAHRNVAIGLSIVLAFWLIAVTSEWRRETVIGAAGVGGEITFAAIFLFMGVTGAGLRHPELERPLAAFCAFYAAYQTLRFGWGLANDRDFLEIYRRGKGGAMMNDLEVIALNLHIHTPFNPGIETLAKLLIFAVPIVMGLALYAAITRRAI
ncbi:MAG: hypothetical protein KY459_08670 [Acidobacteria bacterium]|nr:hypothetical protein [Acidobacteriota bacterium]